MSGALTSQKMVTFLFIAMAAGCNADSCSSDTPGSCPTDVSDLLQTKVKVAGIEEDLKDLVNLIDEDLNEIDGGVKASAGRACFNAGAWLADFTTQIKSSWRVYSEGDQDAVLASLFSAAALGTTNKQFSEFGFPDTSFETSYGNGRHLREKLGFNPSLLMDGSAENHTINLHRHFCTADNIVSLFDSHDVPQELDYTSIDIDSCDLWVFLALTKKYRPRVVTVEYNSNYAWGDFSTQRCADPLAKDAYVWGEDNIYGASLNAIELAARQREYTLVYVTPTLDAFLVRDDLICPGSAPPAATFKDATGLPLHGEYHDKFGPKKELLMDFREWRG